MRELRREAQEAIKAVDELIAASRHYASGLPCGRIALEKHDNVPERRNVGTVTVMRA
jgi:hypothetical protein